MKQLFIQKFYSEIVLNIFIRIGLTAQSKFYEKDSCYSSEWDTTKFENLPRFCNNEF